MEVKRELITLVFISFTFLLKGVALDEINLLRWAGPPGTKPGTFREWIASHPYSELSITESSKVSYKQREKKVVIFTDQSIALSLQDEINQLITNLVSEGFSVLNYEISGGTPESLRVFLQSLYAADSIEGALFIGNIPVVWFQVKNDYNEYGYAEWPVDLFYMDLDGNWFDTLKYDPIDTLVMGQDSIYDVHSGDVVPEIYIGRLMPTGIGDDTLLLQNYFSKDNDYRDGSIELLHRALVYVDDDWMPWADAWASDVALLYDDTLFVSHPEVTRASDYKVRLDTVRAWVSVFAHSWPGGHQFTYNNHSSYDYFYSHEYTNQDPPANFYNHFACSFARYTTNGYGGGRAIFNQSYGLGAVGSTKTGSMLDFSYFYQPLSEDKNLGEAFRDWFTYIVEDTVTFNELCWHYGMTLLGDPFLKPKGHTSGLREVSREMDGHLYLLPMISFSSNIIRIEYEIESRLLTTIKLYDISGRLLRTIYSGIVEPGHNEFSFNKEDMKSGIYFIRLKNDEITRVGKIIIM